MKCGFHSTLAEGLQPRVLGEGLLPSLVGNLVGDRAVELESHPRGLVAQRLCNRLRCPAADIVKRAMPQRMWVLLGTSSRAA